MWGSLSSGRRQLFRGHNPVTLAPLQQAFILVVRLVPDGQSWSWPLGNNGLHLVDDLRQTTAFSSQLFLFLRPVSALSLGRSSLGAQWYHETPAPFLARDCTPDFQPPPVPPHWTNTPRPRPGRPPLQAHFADER